jgi:cytidine deaminase
MLDSWKPLIDAARCAAEASYSPYSKFRVGAAVLAGGKVYSGCNIENASLGLTVCAERVAIFAAIAAGNKVIDAIAVTCLDCEFDDGTVATRMPCGACRQVMAEFGSAPMPIYVDGVNEFSLSALLPDAFELRDA